MQKNILIVILSLVCCLHLSGQTRETHIEGRIINPDGKSVADVNVFASKVGQKYKIFTSCLSGDDGTYALTVRTSDDTLCIHVSGFDVAPAEVICLNKSQKLDITVTEKAQEIKEVSIRAQKVYSTGDTINYNVVQFQNKNDVSIGQVLERLPGVTVSESGKIQYKGLDIKNFYIEGLDLMKGRYGIATNNIDPNAIGTIQILENHQDVKALKDLKPEEHASINLKLKNGVSGVFNLIGSLGAGYYENHFMNSKELIATYFRRNSQLFATYKDNNTGTDIETELTSFDENDNLHTSPITDISMPVIQGVSKRYYYYNKTHSATYNQVMRAGGNGELGINALYITDRDTRGSRSASNTLLPDGTRNYQNEIFTGERHKNTFNGNLTYMLNNDSTYVKEQVKADWISTNANSGLYTEEEVFQSNKMKNYRLHNFLHITKRTNSERGIELTSRVNVEKRPHSLTVSPCLFNDILEQGDMEQEAETRNISTHNTFQILSAIVLGKLRINPSAAVNLSNDELISTLQRYKNNLALTTLDTRLYLNADSKIRKFYFNIHLSGSYKMYKLKDRIADTKDGKHRFAFEPSVSLSYNIQASDDINAEYLLSHTDPSIEDMYDQFILTSYRQISYFSNRYMYQGQYQSVSFRYNHKNVLSMLFCGIDLNYMHSSPDVLYGTYYDGQVERVTSIPTSESADRYYASIRYSKGFDWRRLKIGAQATYSLGESPMLIQDDIIRYEYNSMEANMDIHCSLFSSLAIGYDGTFFRSKNKMQRGGSNPPLKTASNRLSMDFYLPYDISVGASATHYYNDRNEKNKSFLLGEVNAKYTYDRWSFTFTCDNVFDKKEYVYSSSNNLTTNTSTYELRPRSFMLKIRCRII